ncbi:pilus assembly protein PilY [Rhodanobacter sp. FDAARGOS 1247]|uniref:pilus assembly protein n=1 Tax=Rhodanobacter sp. FDAARGOS 1247 TaxID=2778082 RepID=UPI00194F0661|nr:PilC/PilY family type IV pilus protein [Rhodanobacter sp. FDAARGOS 1247]QRP65053.1 pilus assembly protein PilY [Rhodanobacter sp. FDAARGOS 1247]
MNTSFRPRSKSAGFFSRLLYTGLSIWMLGAVYTPALAAVTVDQSPLIIQRSLPPNVTLMLDDSGSMDWDFMPDWDYLDTNLDPLRNAAKNGVYYNPDITYAPPLKADGTSYPNSPSLTGAYKDGFRDTSTTDVTQYASPSVSNSYFKYYTQFTFTSTSTYTTSTLGCDDGDSLRTSTPNKGKCEHYSRRNGYSYYNPYYVCNQGDSGPDSSNVCTTTTYSYKYYFTYTTGASDTKHYVGASGDCAVLPTASKAVCDDSATVQQNVANWFSYYRTRMLMAKSGLMSAFSTMDTTFRVGFGSINGNNNDGLPSDSATYNSREIAQVAPFGNDYSAKQKNKFWSWLNDISPGSGTPLRLSLDAVGQYYQSAQPWKGMESDPDYTTAAASAQLACRQSYTILTTDGFWNGGTPSGIGDTDGTDGPTVTGPNDQTLTYASVLPFADGIGTTAVDTQPATCDDYRYVLTPPDGSHSKYYCYRASRGSETTPVCGSRGYSLSSDRGTCSKTTTTGKHYADTLADVAMKYWKADLQPDISNEVPTNAEDKAFWQHMATFTLGLGFSPVDSKDTDGTSDDTALDIPRIAAWANGDATKAITDFSWPQPSSDSLNNIADLAHAAVNGHGGFYSAKSPEEFANGLKDALKRASERVGTGASLAANSTQLQTGTVAYQANYWTAKWKGDLKALAVSSDGTIAGTPDWNAATKLPATSSRNIKTYNPTAAAGSQFVAFEVASDGTLPALSTAQNTALSAVAGTATNESNLINYLRGDSANEQTNGGSYRNRDSAIGDIVNSQPVYVGAPNPNQFYTESFTGSNVFSTYASNNASRAGAIYVASNDGMLHSFNASTGAENFAYLPGAVITSGVSALASVDYGGSVAHGFFNDGELTVGDAYIGSTPGWKTVLVGTTGRGVAKTVYALDVTDPADVKFLWERSAADGKTDSNYIGQMTGKPVIAQSANGTWAVLIGNGYNSAAGKSALLQFDLADGTLHVHATTDTSGLAAPAVWMDPSGNGVSTVAYAGDANGNLWSFAINTSAGTSSTATPTSAGVKLFTAVDDDGNAQPITGGMLAGKDPATGNTWVFFGTGRYLTTTDLADTSTQSWYGLIVQSGTDGLAVTSDMTRADDLAKRSITAEVDDGRTETTLAQATAAGTSIEGKSGWYMDLTSPVNGAEGERMVTPNQFQGNLLLGTTRIPKASDPCNPSGQGWIMSIDPFTGTNPDGPFFDANNDGKVDSSDSINGTPVAGIGYSSLPNNPIFVGSTMLVSFDNGTTSSKKTSSSTGQIQRVSWRELIAQ